MVDQQSILDNDIWVFSYGSLMWRPGFNYEERLTGFVTGFSRRFWQGNEWHRGTKSQPARVATLVPEKDGRTWGCAYRINKRNGEQILKYLENREMELGGYSCVWTEFFPLTISLTSRKQCKEDEEEEEEEEEEMVVYENVDSRMIPSLCYVALENNPFWLGEESEAVIASEVAGSYGFCGSNRDYVLNLYKCMKSSFPFVEDDHLEKIVQFL